MLITEPKGIVYLKFNPFEESKRILTHINIPNLQIPTINLPGLELPGFTRKLKARGFVDFSKLSDIRLKKKSFGIKTPMRTWKFKCATIQERDEWVEAIRQVAKDNLATPGHHTVQLEEDPENNDNTNKQTELELEL